uniref:Uncharacterized protein n=1 Tax=Cajanus cajan TaxID=3821 RepID=A0A151TYQ7_CAJCA|nr:hypothetical protein KK1_004789 [Cajanus cajan]
MAALTPYLDTKTLPHREFSSWNNFHLHFASSASLNKSSLLMPKPPSSLGMVILFQETHAIFASSFLAPQKN